MTDNKKYLDLVTIIIPTYKRPTMLKRAIDSVLNQTYKNIEILVVDDNNADSLDRKDTEIIMENYIENKKVKYIKHKYNKNGSAARNTGIRNSKGVYVCFLDDDNYFIKNKISKQVNYLKENPTKKAVYTGLFLKKGERISKLEGNLMFEQFTGENIIDTNTIMMERKIIKSFDGWNEKLSRNQDVAFMIDYFETGNEVGVISEPLVYYDLTDRSNVGSAQKNEKDTEQFLKIYNHQISEMSGQITNAKKYIYSYRYRAILLRYIKEGFFLDSFRIYMRMIIYAPVTFNKLLLRRIIKGY